jgi:hypothetical protein
VLSTWIPTGQAALSCLGILQRLDAARHRLADRAHPGSSQPVLPRRQQRRAERRILVLQELHNRHRLRDVRRVQPHSRVIETKHSNRGRSITHQVNAHTDARRRGRRFNLGSNACVILLPRRGVEHLEHGNLLPGSGRYRSPRHRMPLNSRHQGAGAPRAWQILHALSSIECHFSQGTRVQSDLEPGRYCSPRHRMPLKSGSEGSKGVRGGQICQASPAAAC